MDEWCIVIGLTFFAQYKTARIGSIKEKDLMLGKGLMTISGFKKGSL